MTITFKSFFAAAITLILPGLGQLLYGKWAWGFFWFWAGIFTAGLANWAAAVHCLIIGNE